MFCSRNFSYRKRRTHKKYNLLIYVMFFLPETYYFLRHCESELLDRRQGGVILVAPPSPKDDVINSTMCQEIDWFRGEVSSRQSSGNGFCSK